MNPGDLVQIIDYGGYYSCDPPRIGIIVEFYGGVRVLTHEGIGRYALRDLRPLVNPDNGGYDDTNEGGKWEESNVHWLEGKRRAMRALGMEEE